MKSHSILLILCLTISTGGIGAAYLSAGYWQIILIFPILALLWLMAKRFAFFWLASTFLVFYILLAAIGIIIDLSLLLMLIAGTTALASWELMIFAQKKAENSFSQMNDLLEKIHLKIFALATITGLVLVLLSSSISLELPFSVTSILVLIVFGGFLLGLRFVGNQSS